MVIPMETIFLDDLYEAYKDTFTLSEGEGQGRYRPPFKECILDFSGVKVHSQFFEGQEQTARYAGHFLQQMQKEQQILEKDYHLTNAEMLQIDLKTVHDKRLVGHLQACRNLSDYMVKYINGNYGCISRLDTTVNGVPFGSVITAMDDDGFVYPGAHLEQVSNVDFHDKEKRVHDIVSQASRFSLFAFRLACTCDDIKVMRATKEIAKERNLPHVPKNKRYILALQVKRNGRTITIPSFRVKSTGDGKTPLHVRRGHFADYTKGPGRFGRADQKKIYWVDEMLVGNKKNGVIEKDYKFR